MILAIKRNNSDEDIKKKRKKSIVFLVFCVSVGSFCDELTVVFCLFVCLFLFLLICMLLRGEVAGWVSFPSFVGSGVGRTQEAQTTRRRDKGKICTVAEKGKIYLKEKKKKKRTG